MVNGEDRNRTSGEGGTGRGGGTAWLSSDTEGDTCHVSVGSGWMLVWCSAV